MEFRDGKATGRLLDPIVRPRGPFAWLASGTTDGRISREKLLRQLGLGRSKPEQLETAVQIRQRGQRCPRARPVALFGEHAASRALAVRESLAGNRHLLLIGVTGFIGKVWLVDLLENIPEYRQDHAADPPQPHNFGAAAL